MGLFDRFTPREEEEDFEVDEREVVEKNDTPRTSSAAKSKKQVVLFRPNDSSNEQLFAIADHLLNRESVILNLELIAKESRHFVDFLSGVAYALQGQTKKVAANTFLITPGGVEVTGDIVFGIESELRF